METLNMVAVVLAMRNHRCKSLTTVVDFVAGVSICYGKHMSRPDNL
jgi:hypothetical protein